MIEFLNPVDVYVGGRIRATRVFRNLEPWELAKAVGVPASLLFEYEAGKLRCSPQHLYAIAGRLSVRGSFFFQNLSRHSPLSELSLASKIYLWDRSANDNFAHLDKRFS